MNLTVFCLSFDISRNHFKCKHRGYCVPTLRPERYLHCSCPLEQMSQPLQFLVGPLHYIQRIQLLLRGFSHDVSLHSFIVSINLNVYVIIYCYIIPYKFISMKVIVSIVCGQCYVCLRAQRRKRASFRNGATNDEEKSCGISYESSIKSVGQSKKQTFDIHLLIMYHPTINQNTQYFCLSNAEERVGTAVGVGSGAGARARRPHWLKRQTNV